MDNEEITTIEEIQKAVARIEATAHDSEVAHSDEDDLWASVLTAIAEGAENPAELAKEALKTLDLDFARWYA